jgi:hypothetical protein
MEAAQAWVLALELFLLLADKAMPLQELIHNSKNKRFDVIDILLISSRYSDSTNLRDSLESVSWDHKPDRPLRQGV